MFELIATQTPDFEVRRSDGRLYQMAHRPKVGALRDLVFGFKIGLGHRAFHVPLAME